MKTQIAKLTQKLIFTTLCTALLTSPALAKTSEQNVEQFLRQHFLTMLRITANTSALMLEEELTSKQTACIDSTLNAAANKFIIKLSPQERKSISDLINTSVGKSMQKYNQKITSAANEEANIFSFAEEWQQRLDGIKSDKERDIAYKANPVLESIINKNGQLINDLPHAINKKCGTNLPAQPLQ